jgi:hypothetical protein
MTGFSKVLVVKEDVVGTLDARFRLFYLFDLTAGWGYYS